MGGAHLLFPVPQLEGRGDAEPGDPSRCAGDRSDSSSCKSGGDEIEQSLRRRIVIGLVHLAPHFTREIEQDEIAGAPARLSGRWKRRRPD